jgi:proteasome lid subunit RPN8/RPN11
LKNHNILQWHILRKTRPWRIQPSDTWLDICGFYHSHPDHPCVPSEHDRKLAWEGYLYLIVSVKGGLFDEAGAWTYDQNQKQFNEVIIQYKYRKNKAAAVNPEESKP